MTSKIYFFKKDKYVQIDPDSKKVDSGYPRSIADDWNGLKEIGFDSDLNGAAYINNALYLFKKEKYVEYDLGNDKIKGDALPLSSLFKNLPGKMQSGFDACAYWRPSEFFIFKDNQSASCNTENSPFVFGDAYDFSSLHGNGWVALPSSFKSGVDAGLTKFSGASFDSVDGTVFFKDSQMAVYTAESTCSNAQAIQSVWHGLDGTDFAEGIDAAVQLPTEKKSHGNGPSPALQTGRQCCFDLPPNTTFYVAAMNTEKWVRTVHVTIDGKEAKPVNLPAHDNGLVQVYKSGAGSPPSGKSGVCIGIDDSQSGHMLLGWYPPVVVADGEFVNIGAEKDYRKETGFNDAAVCVFWRKS
ncbi:hemopexin repeat-containing protein [Chelativorans salis]|uniref:Hemopexin repeat-containing protein n=1 Tax=Chelativorans salis TaxID=2978478 RepID=A0ABT2LXF1_9HYPH|nr:hemopexin repeat-containing protein [Chelativorans sp. EGI FJ00035]MCT7378063.1 hemopexin repeat-containing protein [Chelativorans sp. EGI FJ00035]